MIKDRIFDTLFDTNKKFVAMRTNFNLRNYKNKEGEGVIYLTISSGKERERINLDLTVNTKHGDKTKQRVRSSGNQTKDVNLVLDNIESKLLNIKTVFI